MKATPKIPGSNESPGSADPRDAEIARLRAQLAAATTPGSEAVFIDAEAPNGRRYKAESKHLHLTCAQLHAQVVSGEIRLDEHHVLCSDGWYVDPLASVMPV